MTFKEAFYPELGFGGYTDIDGTVAFYNRVNSLLRPADVLLDVGCGRGEYNEDPVAIRRNLRVLRGKVGKVVGMDVDPAARSNPFVDEFHLLQGGDWPIKRNSVDVVLLDNVIEHVADMDSLFENIRRVLRPGGHLCIRTTNRLSYVGVAATVIPNKFHAKVTSAVQDSRKENDVFPTLYRCNSVRKLRNTMRDSGFDCVVYGYESEPAYLSFSKVAYVLGVLHQKFAPSFIKPTLFAFGRLKKTATEAGKAVA